jgi:photosystem II stability/assembly factor-like uncharacterized protein
MTAKTEQHPTSRRARVDQARRRAQTRRRIGWSVVTAVAVIAIAAVLLARRDAGGDATGVPVVGADLHSLVTPDGTTLYAGGHTAVSVSHDGGATWSRVPSLDDADAMAWAFLDGSVWVGGHPGLSVSTDEGSTFTQHDDGLPATDIHSLGGSGDLLYAGSPGAGFLVSLDGGTTWNVVNPQVGQSFMGRIQVDPRDPEHAITTDMQAGAVETSDGGRTWKALGGVPGAMWITWDPKHVDHLLVAGDGRAAVSSDGGATWSPVTVPTGVTVVEMDPTDPRHLFAAAHDGNSARIWVSTDGGGTWTEP